MRPNLPTIQELKDRAQNLIDPNLTRANARVYSGILAAGTVLSLEGVFGLAQDAKNDNWGFAIVAGGLAIFHAATQLGGGYFKDQGNANEELEDDVSQDDLIDQLSAEDREAFLNRPLSIEELLQEDQMDMVVGDDFVESLEFPEEEAPTNIINLNDYRQQG